MSYEIREALYIIPGHGFSKGAWGRVGWQADAVSNDGRGVLVPGVKKVLMETKYRNSACAPFHDVCA